VVLGKAIAVNQTLQTLRYIHASETTLWEDCVITVSGSVPKNTWLNRAGAPGQAGQALA